MKLIAISDIHIRDEGDPLYTKLLRLLETLESGDVLILGGDLFDLFIGDKPVFMVRYRAFLELLRSLDEKGVITHYIEGNHDFHLQGVFRGFKHLQLHESQVVVSCGGKRFFIAHGDLVDSSDYSYRLLRAGYRSLLARGLLRVLRGEWIDAFGQHQSERSRTKHVGAADELPTKKLEELRHKYRNFACERVREGFDFVILGHCHDHDEFAIRLGDQEGQYMNIGFPRKHGTYVYWTPELPKMVRKTLT